MENKSLFTSLFGILVFSFLFSIPANSQKIDKKVYRADMKTAMSLYKKNYFEKAAAKFQEGFDKQNGIAQTYHRFRAAVSYAEIKNKTSTFFHLNKLMEKGSSTNIRDVRNQESFEKYHRSKEWKILDKKMSKRMEVLTAHHKNLKVFNHKKSMVYSAIRISPKGDTLANTEILLAPDGTGWGGPAVKQTQIVCHYSYTAQDSIEHIDELREVVTDKFWLNKDSTGIIEDETEVWMHPFRYNEFYKTEIAPFPTVKFPISNESMVAETPKIVIMRNWGTYSPTITENRYFYTGKEKKDYAFQKEVDCHRFLAYGHNSVHGISSIEYFFHEEFGFTEMNYETYDQDIIEFKMVKIEYMDK